MMYYVMMMHQLVLLYGGYSIGRAQDLSANIDITVVNSHIYYRQNNTANIFLNYKNFRKVTPHKNTIRR